MSYLILELAFLVTAQAAEVKPAGGPPLTADQMSEKVIASIAFVGGKYGHGLGFLVGERIIATNAHVVRSDLVGDLKVKFLDGPIKRHEEHKAELLFESKADDLALLFIPEPKQKRPTLKLNADYDPKGKETIYAVGNPGQPGGGVSKVNSAARGNADGFVAINNRQFIQLRFPVTRDEIHVGPGNSGCPVFDRNGEVIGVLNSGHVDPRSRMPTGKAYCIPSEILRKALTEVESEGAREENIRKATVKHNIDLAVAAVYMRASIAKFIIDYRAKNAQFGGALFNDSELVKETKKLDTAMKDQVAAAVKTVVRAQEFTAKLRSDFTDFRDSTDLVCQSVYKTQIDKAKLDQIRKSIEKNGKILDKLLTACNLTKEDLEEMQSALLAGLPDK